MLRHSRLFFNVTAAAGLYTLSLHDALPISGVDRARIAAEQAVACPLLEGVNLSGARGVVVNITPRAPDRLTPSSKRSEEHTSELQSLTKLVCRLPLDKKKKTKQRPTRPAHH